MLSDSYLYVSRLLNGIVSNEKYISLTNQQ